jgi:NAD(P) transhydrogenase subunit alpha
VTGLEEASTTAQIMGFFAVLLASINVFGGFLVTNRMLAMFKKKK